MARLENTVVMIAGGAQGIGEGIARRLASEGAAIAIADLNGDKAKAVAETLKGEGAAGAISVQVDVGDRGQVQAAIKAVVDSFSRLDVLFNNAGFNKPLPFLEVDEANFNCIMRVNTWGVMLGIQARLSGSSWAQAELELVRVERRGRRRFAESCEVFSVHEVGPNESNKF